ncbi:hypothetical protein [Arthrobacter sp. N1]|uniref:hypothetical protein n=1 Tax=Arthrobacter sp. N1 TaxID=619291 RepID=UPI003BAE69FE
MIETKRCVVGSMADGIRQQVRDKVQTAATVAVAVASPAVVGGVVIGNLLVHPQVGSSIEKAALLLPELVGGKAGTKTPIADLVGIANEYSSRAWWGGGPLSNGGSGMAGGDANRAAVAKLAVGIGVAGITTAAILLELKAKKDKEARELAAANACPVCRAPMSAPVEGDGFTLGARCPKGHEQDHRDLK